MQGGTFTITNPGIFGALFGLPIINQPQVAILGVGSIEKRVVVVDDAIAIRPMCYLTLGYDHRLIDGADAGRFLQALKDRLENFDESWACSHGGRTVRRARATPSSLAVRGSVWSTTTTGWRCSALVEERRAGRDSRHAAAARASAGHHPRREAGADRAHIVASRRTLCAGAASRSTRPAAAAT